MVGGGRADDGGTLDDGSAVEDSSGVPSVSLVVVVETVCGGGRRGVGGPVVLPAGRASVRYPHSHVPLGREG